VTVVQGPSADDERRKSRPAAQWAQGRCEHGQNISVVLGSVVQTQVSATSATENRTSNKAVNAEHTERSYYQLTLKDT